MENVFKAYYESEPGLIEITAGETGIITLYFTKKKSNLKSDSKSFPVHLKDCIRQLDEYFKGKRMTFDLPLIISGTDFQKKVWNELKKIPFGKTASYKEIALKAGNIKAVRAIGNANNKNKIAVIIPCHRVIGSDGKLSGYAGGVKRKKWLLEHERNFLINN
ncbi:MAG: methylated-DNA--[protein]-cysteine S-methyltransferase [Ignavibacteria bacterium]|nr:methylated-DNA--[protein]-cysteine S-methyltransferase [Ignavibacteria bacterium]